MTGAIFHLSLPARNLAETEHFYCSVLGAVPGRASAEWIDLILFGHQVTFHERPDEVVSLNAQGVQHFGAILSWPEWERLCASLEAAAYPLLLAPTVFGPGSAAENAKVVFRDPSGHMLELKAYRDLSTVLPGDRGELTPQVQHP